MKGQLAAGFLAAGVLVGGAAAVSLVQTPTTTAEGTRLLGQPAEGLTKAALEARLRGLVNAQPPTLDVIAGVRHTDVARTSLGVTVDVGATAEKALEESGSRTLFGTVTFGGGKDITPQLAIDADELNASVARLVKLAQVEDFDGDLSWDGSRFVVKPPTPGQSATSRVVQSALLDTTRRLDAEIEIPVDEQPAGVTRDELDALAAKAQDVVRPVRLVAADLTSTVPLDVLAPLVTITADRPPALALRASPTRALATGLAQALSRPPLEPQFATPPSTVVLTEKGNVSWRPRPADVRVAKKSEVGLAVTPAQVTDVLNGALRAARPAVNLRPALVRPALSDALARRVNSLLGSFTTPFACCQPRVHNIQLIARTIDGRVILPGESFSLNGIVGRRTTAKGYVEAPFILDGKLDLDIGGGVSQFATTMYNAAFFGGLQLDSHKAHSFYISRYPPGREATVNYPGIDLTWTNNTNVPVVIDTSSSSTSVTVSLYGDNGGRAVTAVAGPREPVPGKDFRIRVTRTITMPGGQVETEQIRTLYAKPPEDH